MVALEFISQQREMSALHEHQQEIVAVARQQNVLLVAPQRVGKTYTASHVLREHLLATAASRFAVAVAASEPERASLYQELARVCGIPILWCDAGDDNAAKRAGSSETKPQVSGDKVNAVARRWETDMAWVQQQLATCLEQCQRGILVVSPKILQILLRKQLLPVMRVSILVIEETEHVHTTSPSFYTLLVDHLTALNEDARPRIFATTRVPASKLNLGGANRHALYAHIHVFTVAPVLNPAVVTAPPSFPPLLCEPFDPKVAAADDEDKAASSSSHPRYEIAVGMRDFLFGENDKKIDFIRVFRMELEMGNSAAVYDEKKRQDKVNQFIQDADSVYQHLGYWCLLKFIKLELQANLKACLVDDDQNVNHRRKRQQEATRNAKTGRAHGNDENEDGEVDEDDETMQSDEDENDGAQSDLLAELIESKMDLDETTQQKVRPILKLISWLDVQTKKLGVRHATPRLIKTADVVRSRLHNGGHGKRAWVFLQRRPHCRVVADYLTVCLAEIGLPPCCCMLGNSHARVSGSLHFSSFLKVMTMFTQCKTNVMVTTSIANKSQKQRMEPPLCDLVVVMDELLEANKLFEFGKRAHPVTGVIKYVTPNTPSDFKKFDALVKKMHEFVQVEEEQQRAQQSQNTMSTTVSSAMSDAGDNTAANMIAQSQSNMLPGRLQVVLREITSANPNEIMNRDTGAVLNLANSVACLSQFCDTLPGLDTYDQRPQYTVKRHPVSSGMSLATKQYKKKKLKYNSKLYDKIDDCRADADAKTAKDNATDEDNRFQFAAELKLPMSLGIKKKLVSHKVSTVAEAKGIVAFKACQELIKKGLLDRHFRSKLIEDQTATIHGSDKDDAHDAATKRIGRGDADDTTIIDADDLSSQNHKLADLSTQNSYDLPPVSAAELSLIPIRSLLRGETNETPSPPSSTASIESESVTMCFYGLTGVRFAILATKPLYTGNTNTGWRYDFATSDVMEPVLRPVTLAKEPTKVTLTKLELQQALHFHLVTMRLACMEVQDAMRDIDIAGENVWKEFSAQNDKGYLVVPSLFDATTKVFSIDWEYLRDIIEKPLIQPIWPFPEVTAECPQEEWICVPTHRRNVTYVVKGLSEAQTVADIKVAFADKETWNKHAKAGKSAQGNPILGRWHTQDQILGAEDNQPLLYGIQTPPIVPIIRRVMQRNNSEESIAQSSTKFNERLLIPQYTSLLHLTKTRYFEAIGIVPVLYEFERKCQMSNLMEKIGLELDISLLDDATSKPAYERLEILGDTYLKLETSWFMYENRKDISQEGDLTRLRRDIIRNDRLNTFALTARLHHYILYPAQIEQHPFEFWKPSCMGKTPKPVVAPSKWIADVLEAICGAYLLGQGEKGARYFLKWIGVSVLEEPFMFARPFYPDCFPCELYDDDMIDGNGGNALSLNFSIARFEDLPQRLVLLQQRLKYTFKNKRLLLEAVTHPNAGHLVLLMDASAQNSNPSSASSRKPSAISKEKTVWKGDYERLEYLGDAIIEYLTLSYAFLAHDKWLPGSLSQWKSATVSNDALGKTALACFGVDECICAGAVRMDRETMQIVDRIERKYPRAGNSMSGSRSNFAGTFAPLPPKKKKKPKLTGTNPMSLPKMFADVFEALVAAVFLDSGKDLQKTRDVFLGPLLNTVGKDAFAYVCHESGLTIDHGNGGIGGDDQDAIMESLFSDDDDDEKVDGTDMFVLYGTYLTQRLPLITAKISQLFASTKRFFLQRASTMFLRISIRDKLFLFTAISGALFVYALSQCPVLEFHELSKLLPAMSSSSSFKDQIGFLNALRWLENLHTPQDLEMILQMVMQSPAVANEAIEPSDERSKCRQNASVLYSGFVSNSSNVAPSFLMRLTDIVAFEMYVHCSKMLLQCGLVLFLYRLKTLSRRRAMTTMSLCILVLLCWKMTQSCLQEMLSSRRTAGQNDKPKQHDEAIEMKAALLGTLFLLRFAGMAIVNFIIGRAYQLHFCEPWPETWKRIPQYIGSKNLIVSTFYFASSCVAFMCFTCTALRSLSEAALHFENLVLVCSWAHAMYYRFVSEKQKTS